jgi:hypothetical protein
MNVTSSSKAMATTGLREKLSVGKNLDMYLAWGTVYALVAYFTSAFFMGDTVDYAGDVYNYQLGSGNRLWEFGHLFWRPLGWILLHVSEPLLGTAGPGLRLLPIRIFIGLNWIAGLACILLFWAILRRFSIRRSVAAFATVGFLFSNAFLNFIHSGTSYIPGLAFLLAASYLLSVPMDARNWKLQPFWAACALATAVCLWFPYVFAVPGVLALPVLLNKENPLRWTFTVRVALFVMGLGLASYSTALALNRLFSPHDIYEWATTEGRAFKEINGPVRAIFGFARSFIYMGNDGVLFKRFLFSDPFNAVSLFDLLRLSLIKLLLFYCVLLLTLRQIVSKPRVFWVFTLVAIPVLGFAVYWQGGDLERYLPLYPVFFLGLAHAVDDERAPVYVKWVVGLFLIVCIGSNYRATSSFFLKQEQRRTEERIKGVLPQLKPDSRLVLMDIHDELENFERSFPFDAIVRGKMWRTYPLLNPGTMQTLHWRRDLKTTVLSVWRSGGDVWVSKRLLEPRPHRDWLWVEGGDPRVSWPMVYSCFSDFDYGKSAGGPDGFVLLLPTTKNAAIVGALQDAQI